MKKVLIVILVIILIIAVLAAALVIWQWDNLKAVYTVITKDAAELEQAVTDKREAHRQELLSKAAITVEQPTMEQGEDVLMGSASSEEVKKELGITDLLEKGKQAGVIPDGGSGEAANNSGLTYDELTDICVAEIYNSRVDFMDGLGGIKDDVTEKLEELPEEERTGSKTVELAMESVGDFNELESAMDSQVKDIIDRYEPLLEETDGDTSVLDMLWEHYNDEKETEKAYYISKFAAG